MSLFYTERVSEELGFQKEVNGGNDDDEVSEAQGYGRWDR